MRLPTREVMYPKSGSFGLVTAFPRRVRFRMLNASRREVEALRADHEALAQRHVEVPEAGLPQRVPLLRRRVGARCRRAEGVPVEPHGARSAVQIGAPRRRIADVVVELVAAARADAGDVDVAVRTSNGAPDCAWKMPDTSQSPSTQRSGADGGVQRREAIADLGDSTCGRSRSEMP